MKLLVTGGAGFIGSNFIRYWLKKNHSDRIINLDKLTYAGNLENLREIENHPDYSFVKGDICDSLVVKKAIKGCDLVVHFAAESHVDRSISGPANFIRTNVLGTQVLLEAALREKVTRFHHVSTDEVFGALPLASEKKFNEKTPYNPRSPYAASKAASDHLVRAYFYTYNLPITITNCSNNIGPFQNPEKFIPQIIINALQNKMVPIYGDGLYLRDWLYVEDHCRAIEMVLKKGKIGETYCVGGLSQELNNLMVAKKILKMMGKSEALITFVKDRPGHDRKYAVDWSKIKKDLSWQPKSDFDAWLKKTIAWYRKNYLWWKALL